jgi:hypothetical protein
MKKQTSNKQSHELLTLMNIGKATLTDLKLLGIDTIQNLAQSDPDELYMRLQRITGQRHDPCVWDVFAAIIHEARTGIKQPWWEWTEQHEKNGQQS